LGLDDVQRVVSALIPDVAVLQACLAPAVAGESAAPGVGRLDALAKCRAAVRDCLLAVGRGFHWAVAARLAVPVYWDARALRDVQGQFPARQLQVALQKVV
jgi:hypothetical protein